MKRIAGMILLLALLLSGCGGVSKEEYDALVQERDALLAEAELQELQGQEAVPDTVTVTVKVTGEFTATVRSLIPDYVTDCETPYMAVVTLFQGMPFTICTRELTKHLEEGETYVFEVEMRSFEEISREEYESGSLLFPEVAFSMYPSLYISNFRPAEESDCGLDSVHLAYEARET